jgi:hypothetical protein
LERSYGAAGTVIIDVVATGLRKIRENRKVAKWEVHQWALSAKPFSIVATFGSTIF